MADPLTSVDQALASLRNRFIAVGLGALLLSVAIAIWLANLISRPLRRMAAVASAVDSGDLSHRIDYSGDDEVGVLAESFNHMMDRLEEGFRLQRDFVSDASHELRSPLTVLRGRIEQLAEHAGDREAVEAEADELMREVRRMERLTDDMLTLAKAERGGLVQRRRVPIDDFVEDLRRDLPLLGSRHYSVESSLHGDLEADPDRLAQVLRNLVTNAVRHTAADGHIDISIGSENGSAVFAVSDDGTGIEPDQLGRIFDRFHRTDEGRSRAEGGSGLGLAIARAIVEAHGGTITAESTPGEGATIRFSIPGYRQTFAIRSRPQRPPRISRSGLRPPLQSGADSWPIRSRPQRPPRISRSGLRPPLQSGADSWPLGRDLLAGLGVDQGDRRRGAGPSRVDHLAQRRAADQMGGVVDLERLGRQLGAVAVGEAGIPVDVDLESHSRHGRRRS